MDKVAVKEFVREQLGPDWIIPTIWAGNPLPAREHRKWPLPFVVKANHGSCWNIFVREGAPEWSQFEAGWRLSVRRDEIPWELIEQQCAMWLRSRFLPHLHEWGYNCIPRQILVEPFIGTNVSFPTDYKFFVFNGRVEYLYCEIGPGAKKRRYMFNRDWRVQPFGYRYDSDRGRGPEPRQPKHFSKMIDAAEKLGVEFPFVRVDLYDLDPPRFGEMTFYPRSGLVPFSPPEWDSRLGELWQSGRR